MRTTDFLHEEILLAGIHMGQVEADADLLIFSTVFTVAETEQ